MSKLVNNVTVVGGGITGLWQAVACCRAGFRVRLIERSAGVLEPSASSLAAGMLGPDCEGEGAPSIVKTLGHDGIAKWREVFSSLASRGCLVVAGARDQHELDLLARTTSGFTDVAAAELAELEPDMEQRFSRALYYRDEAHVPVHDALEFLVGEVRRLGGEVVFGEVFDQSDVDQLVSSDHCVIDCRGLAARTAPFRGSEDVVSQLRGLRGERLVVACDAVNLTRPVRFLHPRQRVYIAPQGENRYVVGATVIESDDASPPSVRSVLELLGAAYALHPGFGEASVVDCQTGVRPAYPDHLPRAVVAGEGGLICVNGAYRHGFLLAPVLGDAVSKYLCTGRTDHPLMKVGAGSECGHKVL